MHLIRHLLMRALLWGLASSLCFASAFAQTGFVSSQFKSLLNGALHSLVKGSPATRCATSNGIPFLHLYQTTISGLTVTVMGEVILPPGDTLTGIDWNWGDGTTRTGCVYFPESHSYATSGTYTITVTTTGTNGFELERQETVSVHGAQVTPAVSASSSLSLKKTEQLIAGTWTGTYLDYAGQTVGVRVVISVQTATRVTAVLTPFKTKGETGLVPSGSQEWQGTFSPASMTLTLRFGRWLVRGVGYGTCGELVAVVNNDDTHMGGAVQGACRHESLSGLSFSLTRSASTAGPASLSFAQSTLPAAVMGKKYWAVLNAIGGSAPYSWTVINGKLPAGLAMNYGAITGTPTAAGSSSFTIRLQDSTGAEAVKAFALTVNSSAAVNTAMGAPTGTGSPVITKVKWSASSSGHQMISIYGSGFGSYHAYGGDGNHLRLYDITRRWDAGWFHCLNGCPDWVGVDVRSWSSTKIIVSNFSGSYGAYGWLFQPGDEVALYVSNASSSLPPIGFGNAAMMADAARYTVTVPAYSNIAMTSSQPQPPPSHLVVTKLVVVGDPSYHYVVDLPSECTAQGSYTSSDTVKPNATGQTCSHPYIPYATSTTPTDDVPLDITVTYKNPFGTAQIAPRTLELNETAIFGSPDVPQDATCGSTGSNTQIAPFTAILVAGSNPRIEKSGSLSLTYVGTPHWCPTSLPAPKSLGMQLVSIVQNADTAKSAAETIYSGGNAVLTSLQSVQGTASEAISGIQSTDLLGPAAASATNIALGIPKLAAVHFILGVKYNATFPWKLPSGATYGFWVVDRPDKSDGIAAYIGQIFQDMADNCFTRTLCAQFADDISTYLFNRCSDVMLKDGVNYAWFYNELTFEEPLAKGASVPDAHNADSITCIP